jgi:hypothetical protein
MVTALHILGTLYNEAKYTKFGDPGSMIAEFYHREFLKALKKTFSVER